MAEKNKKKKMSSDTILNLTLIATAVGGTGALVALYCVYLRGLKKQYETDKLAYDVYLHGFLNYICGKSEKVRDVLTEEGIIEGEGWNLPLKSDDE